MKSSGYAKEHPREWRKVYWVGRSSGNDDCSGTRCERQAGDGVDPGDEVGGTAAVLCRPARKPARDPGRGDMGGMAVRFAATACCAGDRVQPAEERVAAAGQQERSRGRTEVVGVVAAETISPRSITASTELELRELARSYLALVKDVTRVMSRLKAIYRSRGTAVPAIRRGRCVVYFPLVAGTVHICWYMEGTHEATLVDCEYHLHFSDLCRDDRSRLSQ